MAGGEGTAWCPSQGDAGRRGFFLRVLFTVRLSARLSEVQREDGVILVFMEAWGGLFFLRFGKVNWVGCVGSSSLPLSLSLLGCCVAVSHATLWWRWRLLWWSIVDP